jgi:hypothetical protein
MATRFSGIYSGRARPSPCKFFCTIMTACYTEFPYRTSYNDNIHPNTFLIGVNSCDTLHLQYFCRKVCKQLLFSLFHSMFVANITSQKKEAALLFK